MLHNKVDVETIARFTAELMVRPIADALVKSLSRFRDGRDFIVIGGVGYRYRGRDYYWLQFQINLAVGTALNRDLLHDLQTGKAGCSVLNHS